MSWLLLVALAAPGPVVTTMHFRGAAFDVVELPLDTWDVRVSWKEGGARLESVEGTVRTNAGIFEPGYVPTGLLVSGGVERHPLNTSKGRGNFFLEPNGVFALRDDGASVTETHEFKATGVREATQSGPLLVRRGVLHAQFSKRSPNLALRSGVGVRDAKHVVLVISRDEINLWTLASFFRDALHCPDALYLDGVISALWAPDAGRDDDLEKGPFAGIISATRKR